MDGLEEVFAYNRWANLALIEACRGLDSSTLATRVPGVSGSIGELFTHLVGGERTQILRTQGRQHEGQLKRQSPWPGFEELARLAEESGTELIEIARALEPDATADLAWLGKVYRYPVRFFLVHAAEHGVEHRTEIKVALGALGITTPDLDGWSFAAAAGYGEAV